ncbi:hypothetical protein [Xenorhabdus sp. PB62.4]|uniref:hypothetical protein n=1 Tax=Xenorhabdus sp. PB62.4 TaxID=1851573 RepID=UPI001656BAA2|nr:hypothetical protein [Xenorhabdus sp. PB62.4]MBC8954220.1 non-ribosomal peptide synthetase [Xenorhabdus sp. PB62.4]
MIALEIAAQLGARGITDIHLYLLDSFYRISLSFVHPSWRQMLLQELGLEGDASARRWKPARRMIPFAKVSFPYAMQHSQVTLFKATRLPKLHVQFTQQEMTAVSIDHPIKQETLSGWQSALHHRLCAYPLLR